MPPKKKFKGNTMPEELILLGEMKAELICKSCKKKEVKEFDDTSQLLEHYRRSHFKNQTTSNSEYTYIPIWIFNHFGLGIFMGHFGVLNIVNVQLLMDFCNNDNDTARAIALRVVKVLYLNKYPNPAWSLWKEILLFNYKCIGLELEKVRMYLKKRSNLLKSNLQIEHFTVFRSMENIPRFGILQQPKRQVLETDYNSNFGKLERELASALCKLATTDFRVLQTDTAEKEMREWYKNLNNIVSSLVDCLKSTDQRLQHIEANTDIILSRTETIDQRVILTHTLIEDLQKQVK
jgi:hypothetical protein